LSTESGHCQRNETVLSGDKRLFKTDSQTCALKLFVTVATAPAKPLDLSGETVREKRNFWNLPWVSELFSKSQRSVSLQEFS